MRLRERLSLPASPSRSDGKPAGSLLGEGIIARPQMGYGQRIKAAPKKLWGWLGAPLGKSKHKPQ